MMLSTFLAQATADNRGERARERGLEVGPHRDARRIDAVLPRISDWIPPVMARRGAQAIFARFFAEANAVDRSQPDHPREESTAIYTPIFLSSHP
jgi:hypothetical protein